MEKIDFSRYVGINGEINTESVSAARTALADLCQKEPRKLITLGIVSGGGKCNDGFALYDFVMDILEANLQTVAMGYVGSMAVPLFLMGENRSATKHTRFYLHQIGKTLDKDVRFNQSTFEVETATMQHQTNWYIDIIYHRLKRKLKKREIETMMKRETYFGPKEALEMGFIHKII